MSHETTLNRMYEAFNTRDVQALLDDMTPDVDWPNAWEGGRVNGHAAVLDYWTRQWSQIDPHVEPTAFTQLADGRVAVDVKQVVRDLDGSVLASSEVRHVFAFRGALIAGMDVVPSAARSGERHS